MKLNYRWLLLLLLLLCQLAYAEEAPDKFLQRTADRVLLAIKKQGPIVKKQPLRVSNIVRRYLLPHVAVQIMSRYTVGRSIWHKASSQQRQHFIREFSRLVIDNFARVLATYSDERVVFYPVRGGYKGRKRVRVHSQIFRRGKSTLGMKYRLFAKGSRWIIYDFSIEGVSFLQNYREQFRMDLTKGNMSGLIKRLKQKNRKRGAYPDPQPKFASTLIHRLNLHLVRKCLI